MSQAFAQIGLTQTRVQSRGGPKTLRKQRHGPCLAKRPDLLVLWPSQGWVAAFSAS